MCLILPFAQDVPSIGFFSSANVYWLAFWRLTSSVFKMLCWLHTAQKEKHRLGGAQFCPGDVKHSSFGGWDSLCLLKETAKEKAKRGPLTLLTLRSSLSPWIREVFYHLISATLKKIPGNAQRCCSNPFSIFQGVRTRNQSKDRCSSRITAPSWPWS